MSRFELFQPENRRLQNLLLALAVALLVALYAWMMHDDAQAKIINEHHWGKPSITQQQAFREEAREQLRLARK